MIGLTKKISVIIPNKNSAIIDRVCAALLQQHMDLSSVEVLIVGVDQHQLVPKNQIFTLIPTSATTPASINRNVGLQKAKGDILVFLDSDCIPAPDWLNTLIRHHAKGYLIVGGAVTFDDESYLQTADNVSAFHDLLPFTPPGERLYLVAANMSIRREVWQTVGDFRPDLRRAEDLEWCARMRKMGFTLFFAPQALVHHDPPRTTFRAVWQHWFFDASDTLRVRLCARDVLHTPTLARFRFLYLFAAPLIAFWATWRTFQHPLTRRHYLKTWPLVYLTKIAWCCGAYIQFPASWQTVCH